MTTKMDAVLGHSGCYNKTPWMGGLKTIEIDYNFGSWEVQDQGEGRLSGDSLLPGPQRAIFSVYLKWQNGKEISLGSLS